MIHFWTCSIWFLGDIKINPVRFYAEGQHQADLAPTVLQLGRAGVSLQHVHVCGSRITRPDSLACLPGFNHITEQRSHLAASPPGRRFDTLGLPSLSDPPEMVRPRLLPSLFIRSTVVTPLYSSADRCGHRHRSALASAWQNNPVWKATKDSSSLFLFFFLSFTEMLSDTRPHSLFSHFPVFSLFLQISQPEWIFVTASEERGGGVWSLGVCRFILGHYKYW